MLSTRRRGLLGAYSDPNIMKKFVDSSITRAMTLRGVTHLAPVPVVPTPGGRTLNSATAADPAPIPSETTSPSQKKTSDTSSMMSVTPSPAFPNLDHHGNP